MGPEADEKSQKSDKGAQYLSSDDEYTLFFKVHRIQKLIVLDQFCLKGAPISPPEKIIRATSQCLQ